MEYERMILRLQVKAWAYLDKMGISESDERALLSSLGSGGATTLGSPPWTGSPAGRGTAAD